MLADITSFQQNGMSQAQLASSGESTEGGGLGGLGGRLLLLCCIFLASLQDWDLAWRPMGSAETSQAGRDPPIREGLTGKKRGD